MFTKSWQGCASHAHLAIDGASGSYIDLGEVPQKVLAGDQPGAEIFPALERELLHRGAATRRLDNEVLLNSPFCSFVHHFFIMRRHGAWFFCLSACLLGGPSFAPHELMKLQKRELLQMLRENGLEAKGLSKQELIERLSGVDSEVSQRSVAEMAMEDWQNATTVGFDCKSGTRVADGVDFQIIGPDGEARHTVSFRYQWPPRCTCAEAGRWGSQRRCKHVCMILVKCGVPYAAVADSKWWPDDDEVRSTVDHMLGPFTPIPLSESEAPS